MNDMTAYKLHSAQFSVLGFLLSKLANQHFLFVYWHDEMQNCQDPHVVNA